MEINDYPIDARKRVCETEFLCSITDMTNAEIKLRGQFFDQKSRPQPGQRKLFLQIIVMCNLSNNRAIAGTT